MKEYEALRKKMFEDRQTYKDEDGEYWAVGDMDNYTGAVKGIAIDKLAELEDKIENGTLIELPCKVGDTVYVIDYYSKLEEVTVLDYTLTPKGFTLTVVNEDLLSKYYLFDFDFNKDWFLTKAEAEAKLKELKENV